MDIPRKLKETLFEILKDKEAISQHIDGIAMGCSEVEVPYTGVLCSSEPKVYAGIKLHFYEKQE